jgi:predicted Zn-dependent peptidase
VDQSWRPRLAAGCVQCAVSHGVEVPYTLHMAVEFKHAQLSNGLNIVAELDQSAHTAAMGFFVKTGARDEESRVMGVSHFLEHMMFKGTDKRVAAQVDHDFDDIGADHNAFTTSEMTAFWAHTLPEVLPRAGEILSDIMRPALRPEDFESEKGVILEEIAMYEDHPFWVLYENTLEKYYGSHPLSHRVLGTTQTITDLTRDQMLAYFQNRYSADNTVVALAGRLDFDAMVSLLDQHCCRWQTTNARRVSGAVPRQRDEFTLRSATVNRHYMLMIAPAPANEDPRRYAASILTQILGDTDGSRLYWALIETGLADEAQAQYEPRDGYGEFLAFCSCSPENRDAVKATVLQQIDGLVASLTQDDLERVRSRIATGATLHGELPAGRMRRLGRLWTYMGSYTSLDEELRRINAVTLDDLRSTYAEFPITPLVIGHLTPE